MIQTILSRPCNNKYKNMLGAVDVGPFIVIARVSHAGHIQGYVISANTDGGLYLLWADEFDKLLDRVGLSIHGKRTSIRAYNTNNIGNDRYFPIGPSPGVNVKEIAATATEVINILNEQYWQIIKDNSVLSQVTANFSHFEVISRLMVSPHFNAVKAAYSNFHKPIWGVISDTHPSADRLEVLFIAIAAFMNKKISKDLLLSLLNNESSTPEELLKSLYVRGNLT